jgi:hypothetical protein
VVAAGLALHTPTTFGARTPEVVWVPTVLTVAGVLAIAAAGIDTPCDTSLSRPAAGEMSDKERER